MLRQQGAAFTDICRNCRASNNSDNSLRRVARIIRRWCRRKGGCVTICRVIAGIWAVVGLQNRRHRRQVRSVNLVDVVGGQPRLQAPKALDTKLIRLLIATAKHGSTPARQSIHSSKFPPNQASIVNIADRPKSQLSVIMRCRFRGSYI